MGAHLLNVLPDLADDAATGVRGLPHRLGPRRIAPVAAVVLVVASAVVLVGAAPPLAATVAVAVVVLALAVVVVGHGLLARLARPFPWLTAKALLLALDPATLPEGAAARRQALDAAAAARLADRERGLAPADLLPLPLAALAEWDPAQQGDRRFDDRSVFRPR